MARQEVCWVVHGNRPGANLRGFAVACENRPEAGAQLRSVVLPTSDLNAKTDMQLKARCGQRVE
jgi:hypothetical protein